MARNLLQEFVRAVLAEKAVDIGQASHDGLACFVTHTGITEIVVYKSADALTAFRQAYEKLGHEKTDPKTFIHPFLDVCQRELFKCIVAYIVLQDPENPCNGASIVTNSAAEKGYGPLAYDIAFAYSKHHTLAPDRKSVTSSAKNIWSRMRDGGSSVHSMVDATPLDNIKDPQTPQKEDDCRVFLSDPDWQHNPLNFSYTARNPVNVSALVNNHKKFVDDIDAEFGWEFDQMGERAESWISSILAGRFFSSKYDVGEEYTDS